MTLINERLLLSFGNRGKQFLNCFLQPNKDMKVIVSMIKNRRKFALTDCRNTRKIQILHLVRLGYAYGISLARSQTHL